MRLQSRDAVRKLWLWIRGRACHGPEGTLRGSEGQAPTRGRGLRLALSRVPAALLKSLWELPRGPGGSLRVLPQPGPATRVSACTPTAWLARPGAEWLCVARRGPMSACSFGRVRVRGRAGELTGLERPEESGDSEHAL